MLRRGFPDTQQHEWSKGTDNVNRDPYSIHDYLKGVILVEGGIYGRSGLASDSASVPSITYTEALATGILEFPFRRFNG